MRWSRRSPYRQAAAGLPGSGETRSTRGWDPWFDNDRVHSDSAQTKTRPPTLSPTPTSPWLEPGTGQSPHEPQRESERRQDAGIAQIQSAALTHCYQADTECQAPASF